MRARTSPAGGPLLRPAVRTAALTVAAVLLAGVAGPVAVVRASAAHQPLTVAAVCAVVVLWCIAVGLAAVGAERARRLAAGLADSQAEASTAWADAAAARAEATKARAATEAARAERDAARTECETARAETEAVREELAQAREQVEAERAERLAVDRLGEEVLPALVKRLRDGASVETVLADHRAHPQAALLRTVAEEIGRGERLRLAALAVCATAAGRVQALATSMHAELREMQHRHDEEVLGDLLSLDHSTAQAGRMADSIAVLTGARSGRRWTKPIGVESVLRGALGRIGAYQRVRLHNASSAAVAGYAAEGVMHALAELLDNATNFSAPPGEVHVYVEEVNAGLVITVEDGGLGLSDNWLRRAERAVGPESLDLSLISAGTRLGLAVVGTLARKYGLQVSFRPSSRGGTGVVVLIPEQLITHPEQAVATPAHAPAPESAAADPHSAPAPALTRAPAGTGPALISGALPASAALPASTPAPVRAAVERRSVERAPEAVSDSGLPQRRRGQTLAAATQQSATQQSATQQPTTQQSATQPAASARADAASAAARFGAFRKALRSAQDTPDDSPVSPKDDSR